MKILITTGLSRTSIGGPFQYAPQLGKEFKAMGHEVKIVSYGKIEKILPVGLRHIYFFLRIFLLCLWANRILTLDTFSVGVPSILAARICGKKIVVRVGGDFLWESYVERTGDKITLRQFNSAIPKLNIKERFILYFTKVLIKSADKLVFNTEWQRSVWQETYDISYVKSCVIKNYIPDRNFDSANVQSKRFLWAGRKIKLKNLELLQEVSEELKREIPDFELEIISDIPYLELQDIIRDCYAVVLPSFSEVCPNFILEAVSYNKPFIMTKETGLKEIYNRGGIFIDQFDKKALKEAILCILDPKKYGQYKKELESVQASRSWQTVAQEFLSICQ